MSRRLTQRISHRAIKILFPTSERQALQDLLECYFQVDLAHQIMLREQQIVDPGLSSALITGLLASQREILDDLFGQEAPRGVFLLYESYLGTRVGEDCAGLLQTARSRNDLAATAQRLLIRRSLYRLQLAFLRLAVSSLRIARRHGQVVIPIHTHFQPALPIYYGQYLHSVVLLLKKSVDVLSEIGRDLDLCPLGAGSIAGTNLPIDPNRTATLLGFRKPMSSSIEAIASREPFARLLAELSIASVSISRVAADYQLWTSNEFKLFEVNDSAAGGSSMMPQKKNIYFLEHVKGKSAAVFGGLTAALVSMHATPFSNSIAVGTEAMKHVQPSIEELVDSLTLLRLVMENSTPIKPRADEILAHGFTNATALAELFVTRRLYSFRQAHHRVSMIVRTALENGLRSLSEAIEAGLLRSEEQPTAREMDDLLAFHPARYGIVRTDVALSDDLNALRATFADHYWRIRAIRQRHREAVQSLERIAGGLAARVDEPRDGNCAPANPISPVEVEADW